MKKQIAQVTDRESRMVELLREHPKLMERFEAILGLAQSEGAVARADDIEELLIEEVRRLGKTTMEEWALKAEAKVAAQFQQEHPKSHCAKKKP